MAAPNIPTVTITALDNGASAALSVPLTQVQLNIGCALTGGSASSTAQVFAFSQPAAVQAALVGGPLMEKCGLLCENGGVALAVTCPVAVPGTCTAVTRGAANVGNAIITTTVDSTYGAWDTGFWLIECTAAGTIGTAPGPSVQISADAGRNWSTPISLGSALTYGIGATLNTVTAGGTGIQLGFTTAQTMTVGDQWSFGATGMTWNDAGVQAAISKYAASQYAIAGVGSTHIVGVAAGSDITNFQTYLQNLTTGYLYPRAMVELRDAGAPTIWGGSAETEAAWMTSLGTTTSGLVAQARVNPGAGNYNTPSPFPGVGGGTFSYRRPGSWSQAVRRTQITLPQRAGEVDLGAYSTIAVNPASDPIDGFIYHDERTTPGLNAARIGSLMTWPKQGAGFFQCQEPLLSPLSSQYTELAIGNLVDAASDIAYATGIQIVSNQLIVTTAGTLDPTYRNNLQAKIQKALQAGLVASGLCSAVQVTISPTQNVATQGNVTIPITVWPDPFANAIVFTIQINTGG